MNVKGDLDVVAREFRLRPLIKTALFRVSLSSMPFMMRKPSFELSPNLEYAKPDYHAAGFVIDVFGIR